MKKDSSKYIKIKVETESGNIVKIKDENENDAIEVSEQELREIQQSPNTRQVAEILHTHSSPGCIYVVIRGWVRKVCS
jgi:hypothetical protein